MDVLVTGANGTIGTAIRDQLGERTDYEFTWLDVQDDPGAETVVADARDAEALRPHVEGADAVVHLALNPDLNYRVTDVRWFPALADNLQTTVAVYRAAVAADVEKLVLASSNHAVGRYEAELAPELYDADCDLTVDHETSVRPDSMYGVEKAFGEALGRFCADHYDLRGYALRFGQVLPSAYDHPYGSAERAVEAGRCERGDEYYERRVDHSKALWLSHRDLGHLVDRCLREETVAFDVFYGISDNATRWVDLEHAREVLGYEPADDGAEWTGPPE